MHLIAISLNRALVLVPCIYALFAFRWSAVLIAALVPDLAPFISLIGAVFFSILGLMCPAVIHLATFWDHDDENGVCSEDWDSEDDSDFDGDYIAVSDDVDLDGVRRPSQMRRSSIHRKKGMSRLAIAKDVAIILIALVALVSGSYTSLVDIIALHTGGHEHSGNATVVSTAHANMTSHTVIGPGPESVF